MTTLTPQHRYEDVDVLLMQFTGWTEGDGTGHEGYRVEDFFEADGTYRGPDASGIEPMVAVDAAKIRE